MSTDGNMNIRSIKTRVSTLCFLILLSTTIAFAQESPFAASMRRGAGALRSGDAGTAQKEFGAAVQDEPSSAEAHFNFGLALIQVGKQYEAKEQFERAIALRPAMKGPHLFLGLSLYRMQDLAAAQKALRSEATLSPAQAQVWMWLGVVQMAQGDDLAAVATLQHAQQLKPGDQDILYHLGRAYMQASKLTYQKMYELNPNSWRVHQVLAQSYQEAGRRDDAIAEYKSAIAINPAGPELHMELGDLYRDAVQLDKAEEEYRSELQIDPGNEDAAYRLASILLDQQRPQDAITLLGGLLVNNPDSMMLHYQMGRAQLGMDHLKEAVAELSQVTRNSTKVDSDTLQQTYFYLSRAYRNLGDTASEREALTTFIALKQKNETAERAKLEARALHQEQKQGTADRAVPANQP